MYWKPLFFVVLYSFLAPAKPAAAAQEEQAPMECYFTPPEGWDLADPSFLSPRVKIAFLKKINKGFCPTINLAIEETEASLSEYLKAVKAIHEQDRSNHWRPLGKVRTAAGLAQLTEIDTTSELGPIRLLQLILIKNGSAYILTAAALKEDFPDYYKSFQKSFRSLTLTTDLIGSIPQLDRRESLKEKQQELLGFANEPKFQEAHWQPFQQMVISQYADMGAYWQVLVLRDAQGKLSALQAEPALLVQTDETAQAEPTPLAQAEEPAQAEPAPLAQTDVTAQAEPAPLAQAEEPAQAEPAPLAQVEDLPRAVEENPPLNVE